MSETLTPKQTLLVWCILARQGVAAQAEIEPKVDAPDRKALERHGFVTVAKDGRRLVLRLEDKGWAWAGDHLGDALPRNYRALRDFLMLLRCHLDAAGEDLGGFIGTPPVAKAEPTKKGANKSGGKKSGGKKGVTKPPTDDGQGNAEDRARRADLRTRIETAYLAVTGGKTNVDAKLANVRRHLAPPPERNAVDAELRAMQADGKARLMRLDDRRALTAADEDAAVRHAGEAFHILWIFE